MGERGSAMATVITVVAIVVLFMAGAIALLWPQLHQKSQAALTQQVTAQVVDRQLLPKTGMPGRDYDVRYRYVVEGDTYEATARSIDGELGGDELTVCVDPAHPERNAPAVGGAQCGDAKLGKWTSTAKRVD